jgi:hypothetical protein
LQQGIHNLGVSLGNLAASRQAIVVRALIQRGAGLVPSTESLSEYESARVNLLTAAQSLDETIGALGKFDAKSAAGLIAVFNEEAAKYPAVNISSTSVREIIELAVPSIPVDLFDAKDSVATQAAVDLEQANYPMTGLSTPVAGLGFLPALLAPLGQGCSTAIVAAGAATAGIGSLAIAAGCILGAVAIVAGTIYLAGKGLEALVDLFSRDVAVSKAETERLKQVTANTLALDRLTEGLTPEQKTAVITQYGAQGVRQPTSDGFPWALALAAAAGVGLWLYWPKLKASRMQPAMAGMRRRRRR